MKITFVEEQSGDRPAERSYESRVVTVGRDPSNGLVFGDPALGMVSRRHAEFRREDGRWLLEDIGSTFGTFADGRPVKGPVEVRPGMRVQFGVEGPTVRVVLAVEGPDAGLLERPTIRDPREDAENDGRAPASRPTPEPAATLPDVPSWLEIPGVTGEPSAVIPLVKDVVMVGRDHDVEVRLDALATVVSRRHAQISRRNRQHFLADLDSFNGTYLNGARLTAPAELSDGDRVELGLGGPVLLFRDPPARTGGVTGQKDVGKGAGAGARVAPVIRTVVAGAKSAPRRAAPSAASPKLLTTYPFGGKRQLAVGRANVSDIRLDGLLISNRHAVFTKGGEGIHVEDAGSTNGVYLNGARLTGRRRLGAQDVVEIGPFLLRADPKRAEVSVYDTRSKTRIDVVAVTKDVRNNTGSGTVRLLDGVSLTIRPNEFVGLLGPSGAGKSTLMDALNGMRPATGGQVLVNSLDLYRHLDALKQQIGYVPQDDIIHRELTVYRTLYYVARLRLSRDADAEEIERIVSEVMDLTGLSERRNVPISQLSGGQRKRVSIAVELVTKPSVIFLDEPTSGLDPATEEKIMVLFRQIAESGRTVILTTHAMENVRLFDKIVVMMRGKLVFYGAPHEALAHVGAESFKDLYDRLEAPIAESLAAAGGLGGGLTKDRAAEEVAEEWKERFKRTEQYRRNVVEPASEAGVRGAQEASPKRPGKSPADALRQWATLAARYKEVLSRDKFNLLILFGQAPIIALLTYLVVGADATRDFPYFMLALVAVWFGTSVSAREIIRERAVYNRERMVNLKLLPYVGSKLAVLSAIVVLQCALLFGSLKLLDLTGLMKLPGSYWGLPQLGLMALTGVVGVALGLLVSAVVKTSEMATSLVPLILIPQILFSGLVGVPKGPAKVVGLAMPATWSFDGMKRMSGLDVLRGKDEGAEAARSNEGRGLYKQIEHENRGNIDDTKGKIRRYRADAEKDMEDFEERMEKYQKDLASGRSPKKPKAPKLGPEPEPGKASEVQKNLSGYVDFLHPLGGVWLNAAVLLAMFLGLVAATIQALRSQDIG